MFIVDFSNGFVEQQKSETETAKTTITKDTTEGYEEIIIY